MSVPIVTNPDGSATCCGGSTNLGEVAIGAGLLSGPAGGVVPRILGVGAALDSLATPFVGSLGVGAALDSLATPFVGSLGVGAALEGSGGTPTFIGSLGVGAAFEPGSSGTPTFVGSLGVGAAYVPGSGSGPSTFVALLGVGAELDNQYDMITGDYKLAFSATPLAGFLLCDGSYVSQTTYAALYALLGTTFGPTVGGNFALPDFRSRFPVGAGTGPGLTSRTVGAVGGAESVTLSASQCALPSHSHTIGSGGDNFVTFGSGGAFTFITVGTNIGITVASTDAASAVASTPTPTVPPFTCAGYWFIKV